MIQFEQLNDDARVWVFAANASLTPEQSAAIQHHVNRFLESWSSHGSALRAAAKMVDNAILVVALEESDASGCSIDKLYRLVRDLGDATGASLLGGGRVVYRKNGTIYSLPRSEFRQAVANGEIPANTRVIDTTVARLGEIRSGSWESSTEPPAFRPGLA